MYLAAVVLILLSSIGHGALWIGINNRWHGVGLPRKVIKTGSLLLYGVLFGLPLLAAWRLYGDWSIASSCDSFASLNWALAYVCICAAVAVVHIPIWAFRRWQQMSLPASVRHTEEQVVDIAKVLGGPPTKSPRTKLFCRLPYNHLWEIHVSEYEVTLAGLPRELEAILQSP